MSGFAPRKRASGEKRTSTRDDALNLLSFKSRSVSNLRSALRRKGHSNDEIDEVVAEFLEKGYLNDLKTAEMWSESMMQTGNYGVNGIRTELVREGNSGRHGLIMCRDGVRGLRGVGSGP